MDEQRLIDANALLQKAIEEKRFVLHMEDLLRRDVIVQTAYKDLADFVNSAPTIDAVEVVRCKDCLSREAHFKRNGEVYFYRCNYFDIEIEPLGFCSYGERKDGDE